jgi:hypothetical protein
MRVQRLGFTEMGAWQCAIVVVFDTLAWETVLAIMKN